MYLKMFSVFIFFLKVINSLKVAGNYIRNYLYLNLTNSTYLTFPNINGGLIIRGKGILTIGKNCKINSSLIENPVGLSNKCLFYVSKGAKILIGDNVGISNSLFYANSSIIIGNDVLIGGGCQVLDNDFHSIYYEERKQNLEEFVKTNEIVIKDGAFIGSNTIILKGVIIGERAVVGAGSIVTKSIPIEEIWGGNPAQFIRKIYL